jgi:hypothetical protein
MRHMMNDTQKTRRDEHETETVELPLALVYQFDVMMPMDADEDMQQAIKREVNLAVNKVRSRYGEKAENLHLVLAYAMKSPDIELF